MADKQRNGDPATPEEQGVPEAGKKETRRTVTPGKEKVESSTTREVVRGNVDILQLEFLSTMNRQLNGIRKILEEIRDKK